MPFEIYLRKIGARLSGPLKSALPAVVLALVASPALAQEYVPGEILVKLRGKARTLEAQAFIGKAVSEKSMSLKGSWVALNMHHFALKPGVSVEATLSELKRDPDVEYAEPNYIFRRMSSGPEGAKLSMDEVQSAAISDVGTYSQTTAPIQLPESWAEASDSRVPPIVAVIDTGLDLNHPVFKNSGAIWTNPNEIPNNGIDDDKNGYIDDVNGWNFAYGNNNPMDDDDHGTHVAGIVLGATQNITRSPIEPAKIRIMPLKFLDQNGAGTTADAVKAIYYAVNNGAKVLNNSWGGGGYSAALLSAMAYAYDKKVAFIAAAGNASSNNDSVPTFPANYNVPNVVSVAATSDSDLFASFSNFGAQTVHMGSPGVSVWSTYPYNSWGRASGTSMATPFVAGIVAMMMREAPELTGYQAKSLVFGGAQQISSLQTKTTTKSRLNAYRSVQAAKVTSVDPNQPVYETSSFRAPSSEVAESGGAVGGCGLVAKAVLDSVGKGGGGGTSGPHKNVAFFGLLLVLISPVLLSLALRNRSGKNNRRFTRYQIDSQVRLRFGDRELVGQVSTISLGGVQLNTDAWLEKGGVVKMSIRSPDGRDEIEVDGQIVWSEEQRRYGVAFSNADDPVRSIISRWTQGLLKA